MWPNPKETVDLVTFTEAILNGWLHFLCSVAYDRQHFHMIMKILMLLFFSFKWVVTLRFGDYKIVTEFKLMLYKFCHCNWSRGLRETLYLYIHMGYSYAPTSREILNLFWSNFSFLYRLTFSRGIEIQHWIKMG